jgi:enoyl-CoA hydratase/carnithine racemase
MHDAPTDTSAPAAEGPPTLELRGARADLWLNRPSVHNRIGRDDIAELHRLLDRIALDPSIRVAVLRARGRSFSAGFDLGDLQLSTQGPGLFEELTDAVEDLRCPTICALHAPVYGGASDLALACDFRIGVEGMRMFMPAARLGLQYYPHGLRRWIGRIGLNAAKRLFLTAATVDAATLLEIGFVDELVAPAALDARVDALAELLAAQAPLALEGMKRVLNEAARGAYDEAAARRSYERTLESADLAEGVAAWRDKRTPRFDGR